MLTNITFDQKTRSKLSHEGVSPAQLQQQLNGQPLDFSLELFRAQGLDIVKKDELYYYATTFIPISDAVFCIVDIETNGSKTDKHQIIEIGAVKIQNMQIIDRFESLVHCTNINENITKLTGISSSDTVDAPPLKEVMQRFKLFLADSVFVAHDVKFDFKFVSSMMRQVGLEELLNRHLCSIDLAERTIVSYKYGLAYLNDYLKLYQEATHHRALSDATTATHLFIKSLAQLDETTKSVEDLITFSKKGKRLKRPKLDPMAPQIQEP
jgi:DNA polymerase III subunit epsilon